MDCRPFIACRTSDRGRPREARAPGSLQDPESFKEILFLERDFCASKAFRVEV